MNFKQRKKEFVDKLLNACKGNYSCGRVWEAWQVGTMTQEDFGPLEECEEFINEVADAFSQSLSDYKKELGEEVKKLKNKDCGWTGHGVLAKHMGTYEQIQASKDYAYKKCIEDILSLLQKDKETEK